MNAVADPTFVRNYLERLWHLLDPCDERRARCGMMAEGHTWSEASAAERDPVCPECAEVDVLERVTGLVR